MTKRGRSDASTPARESVEQSADSGLRRSGRVRHQPDRLGDLQSGEPASKRLKSSPFKSEDPVSKKSTPASRKSNPASKKAKSGPKKPTPISKKSTPASTKTTPSKLSTPAEKEISPSSSVHKARKDSQQVKSKEVIENGTNTTKRAATPVQVASVKSSRRGTPVKASSPAKNSAKARSVSPAKSTGFTPDTATDHKEVSLLQPSSAKKTSPGKAISRDKTPATNLKIDSTLKVNNNQLEINTDGSLDPNIQKDSPWGEKAQTPPSVGPLSPEPRSAQSWTVDQGAMYRTESNRGRPRARANHTSRGRYGARKVSPAMPAGQTASQTRQSVSQARTRSQTSKSPGAAKSPLQSKSLSRAKSPAITKATTPIKSPVASKSPRTSKSPAPAKTSSPAKSSASAKFAAAAAAASDHISATSPARVSKSKTRAKSPLKTQSPVRGRKSTSPRSSVKAQSVAKDTETQATASVKASIVPDLPFEWQPKTLVADKRSWLVVNKANIEFMLRRDEAWKGLTPAQQRELIDMLPPAPTLDQQHLEEMMLKTSPDADNASLPNILRERLQSSPAFRSHTRTFMELLKAGHLNADWIAKAEQASARRRNGDFDEWEQKKRENEWPTLNGSSS